MDERLPLGMNAAPAPGGLEPSGRTPGPRPNRITGRPVRDCSTRVFELTVYDAPIPWRRPEENRSFDRKTGQVKVWRYEHDDVREAKGRLKWAARTKLPSGWRPLDCAVKLLVIVYLEPPAYVLESRTPELALPSVRPDDDNYAKLVRDALNAVVWVDDGRIVDGTTRKRYALDGQPRWRILVDRCWREYADDQPEVLTLPLSAAP